MPQALAGAEIGHAPQVAPERYQLSGSQGEVPLEDPGGGRRGGAPLQEIDPDGLGLAVRNLAEGVVAQAAKALRASEGQLVGSAVAGAGEAGWVDERGSSSGRTGRT